MDCKKCQYHTVDGRCLYYIGCPYKPTPNEPTEDDLLEFEAEALGYRRFGKSVEEGERDDRLSDLFDRCGNSVLLRRVSDGESNEMRGDCNICINGKLPSYSASCVECGLLRKNYKPLTNADRIRGMTDEELADLLLHICDWNWLDWLKAPVDGGEQG